MERLQDNSCVTLTAPSGVGKSFITRHTALVLKKEGYNIILVYSPTDIRDYYQPGKQTVFIVDDICGNFTVNQQQIDQWKQMLPVINTIITDKCCKIIVSCRLQVYNDEMFNILSPFKACECNLISDKLCLTSKEKTKIAKTYIGTSVKYIDASSRKWEFFPLLCCLCHEKEDVNVKDFFKNPFGVYKSQLDMLLVHRDEGKYKICSLALCVLFNNQLNETWFQGKMTNEQRQILKDTCEACEFNSIPKAKLKKALDTLVGTFIFKQNGFYRTVHDKLFDFLTHYFGQKMIECLIDHGDSDLVHARFIWRKSSDDKNSNIEFIIEIPDEYLVSYLERFVKDWSARKVTAVFNNNNMKLSSFRQQLLQYLLRLGKLEQETLASTKDKMVQKGSWNSGNTPLVYSCYTGYTDMVQWMLHTDVDVDQCRDDGVTGLFMASQNGHTDIVKLLLERNPNVDLCENDGCSPLFKASQYGHTEIVKLLLEKNPNVDLSSNDGSSPLCMASQDGHTDIVKLLLEKNPDVDLCNKDGGNPLYMASQNGYTDILQLLLEKNPNVDLCNKDGVSPLFMASQNGHTGIVKLLLEKNPKVDLCGNDGVSPLLMASQKGHTFIVKALLEKNPDVDLCNKDGVSPLYMASQNGHTNIVKLLLEKNPNVDLREKNGCSPLCIASQKGHTFIVKALLEKNCHVDLCSNDGCSPLYKASQNGHTDIVKLLLERNPNVGLCDNENRSPLFMASQEGHTDIAKLLLERNSNVDLRDNYGFTPLIQACICNRTSTVHLLITHAPLINAQTFDGGSALYFSALNGNLEMTELLLENNADCNICIHSKQSITDTLNKHPWKTLDKTKQLVFDSLVMNTSSDGIDYVSKKSVNYAFDVVAGSSPLHIACFVGRIDVVRCLLNHNANINIMKEDGTTPLYYASEVGHEDIVRLLLDKGADTLICKLDGKSPLRIATDNGHTSIVVIETEHMTKEGGNMFFKVCSLVSVFLEYF
ncbi:ankyrin repeat domain-containing protein 50-like [Mytilus trossulus]|uniref:ankyrin repeat domain-containing protein 50-like n=1 Tax=Mytilus trossulus TaxID=6551 RepID=UPI00300615D5